eukprot:3121032-Karenia_brevis.AAC.1
MVVFLQKWNQHFSVACAGKYFRVQRMRSHSGRIDKPKTLAAMVVFIQSVPTQTVRRVLAATTVSAKLRACSVQKSSGTRNQHYHIMKRSLPD